MLCRSKAAYNVASGDRCGRIQFRSCRAGAELSFLGVNTERAGTTDSQTFHEANIPTLSLHSLTPHTWKILSWKDYVDTHKLVSALLVYLDVQLP